MVYHLGYVKFSRSRHHFIIIVVMKNSHSTFVSSWHIWRMSMSHIPNVLLVEMTNFRSSRDIGGAKVKCISLLKNGDPKRDALGLPDPSANGIRGDGQNQILWWGHPQGWGGLDGGIIQRPHWGSFHSKDNGKCLEKLWFASCDPNYWFWVSLHVLVCSWISPKIDGPILYPTPRFSGSEWRSKSQFVVGGCWGGVISCLSCVCWGLGVAELQWF